MILAQRADNDIGVLDDVIEGILGCDITCSRIHMVQQSQVCVDRATGPSQASIFDAERTLPCGSGGVRDSSEPLRQSRLPML